MSNINRVLGFDYGTVKIGVATGNVKFGTASPLTILRSSKEKPNWIEITKYVKQWRPDAFVVGLPLARDGTDTEITLKVKQFVEDLKQQFNLPCFLCNERFTSKSAISLMREFEEISGVKPKVKPNKLDDVAAYLIVKQWLDSQ